MAIGDPNDIQSRLNRGMPQGWFGTFADMLNAKEFPFVNAVIAGFANGLSFLYQLYAYAKLQTRISTASDGFLDLIAGDFFGTSLPRIQGEQDASYRARIKAQLIQQKETRAGIIATLQALTGRTPILFEPWYPPDTGAYNVAQSLAYNTVGGWGSMQMPAQFLVTAFRAHSSQGIGNVAGYGISVGAYNTPSQINWSSLANWNANIPDSAIYAAVAQAKAAGVIAWVQIQN